MDGYPSQEETMDKGIIFIAAICTMILIQLIVHATDRKKNHIEIIEKLNLILEKLK